MSKNIQRKIIFWSVVLLFAFVASLTFSTSTMAQNVPYWIDGKDGNRLWFNVNLNNGERKEFLIEKTSGFAPIFASLQLHKV